MMEISGDRAELDVAIAKRNMENAREISERTAEAAERAAYLENNPGDYECPSCKMISLRSGASCCPKCQKEVPVNFWERVAERAAEELKRVEVLRKQEDESRRLANEKHQRWLDSPEYAKDVEIKRLAAEKERLKADAVTREAAEKERERSSRKKAVKYVLMAIVALFYATGFNGASQVTTVLSGLFVVVFIVYLYI